MKKLLLVILVLLCCIPVQKVYASTVKESLNISCNFKDIYPTAWYENDAVMYGGVALSAVAVAGITYLTAGTGTAAAAGPIATYIGSILGGVKGLSGIAATNAGLAMLGGGSVASGGLGVLGGVALISSVGDIALASLIMATLESTPTNKINENFFIAIPIPSDIGSSEVKDYVDEINTLKGSNDEKDRGKILTIIQNLTQKKYPKTEDKSEATYNTIISAICNYNIYEVDTAQQMIQSIQDDFDTQSDGFIQYFLGMIAYAEGDTEKAISLLKKALEKDNDVSIYIVLSMIYNEISTSTDAPVYRQLSKDLAIQTLIIAREKIDDENFTINNTLASYYFDEKQYQNALSMYKEALAEITINEYEAESKMNIAVCYNKLNDDESAAKWYAAALDEVSDNKNLQKHFMEMYDLKTKEID